MYEDFQILLDEPARSLAFGFDDYGDALAEIALRSKPQFAIGIFGDWGSGKTTLMEGIWRHLKSHEDAVCVWFNAWRYEREPHLIVPMLDTLREALLEWAEGLPLGAEEQRSWATRAAAAASRAARAILAGVTLTASVPFVGIEASIDASKAVAAWRSDSEAEAKASAEEPQSFYHASFRALSQAMSEFVSKGARRIVVFVDDLDRCLPENALQVLESMKLFFDIKGFVFVVGLDQRVIEQAVEFRYQSNPRLVAPQAANWAPRGVGAAIPPQAAELTSRTGEPRTRSQTEEQAFLTGANYVKKIFQVQFSVPRIVEADLEKYLDFLAEEAKLPELQRQNLTDVVRPHLSYLTGEGSVNPREVKRLINSYTLQVKMLEKKLAPNPPNPNVVLALQIMLFRHDWEPLYQVLSLEPDVFVDELRKALEDGQGELLLGAARGVPLPPPFATYVRRPAPGSALFDEPLEPYVSSLEAAVSTDTSIIAAMRTLRDLRRTLELPSGAPNRSELSSMVGQLREVLGRRSSDDLSSADANTRILNLQRLFEVTETAPNWRQDVDREMAALEADLRELRRRSTVTARPTA